MITINKHYKKKAITSPVWVVVFTLITAFFFMAVYLHGPLRGDFGKFFLPAKMFGVPAELRLHGIEELYTGEKESGWDGQFYYYISNDPFALKDTASHLDASAYRYQRIGLPFLANLVSKLTLQPWVSPLTYYLTSLSIILIAVGMLAAFLKHSRLNPYFALFWALGFGTQVTQLNALPDAAADGLLIIALICLSRGWLYQYVFSIAFASLAREAYVVFPCCLALAGILFYLRSRPAKLWISLETWIVCVHKIWYHAIPVTIFVAWHFYLRIRFGVSPSSQASGILGGPLVSTFNYMIAGLRGNHPLVGVGNPAYQEGFGILLYLALLVTSVYSLFFLVRKKCFGAKQHVDDGLVVGAALGFFILILMYLCFGPVVMMHHTGYIKAANIFLFTIPFCFAICEVEPKKIVVVILSVVVVFFSYLLWKRIASEPYLPQAYSVAYVSSEPVCLKGYSALIGVDSIQDVPPKSWTQRVFSKHLIVVNTKLTNTSGEVFSPFIGKGSVNISYKWIDSISHKEVADGIRSMLKESLAPNQSTTVPVRVLMPRKPGDYILRISPVQEGCHWFYDVNPVVAVNIPYKIR